MSHEVEKVKIEEVETEAKMYAVAQLVSAELLEKVKEGVYRDGGGIDFITDEMKAIVKIPSVLSDPLAHYFTAVIKTYVPTKLLSSYRWPKTWWDAFKLRWFTKKMLQRWPVKYDGVDISALINHPIPRNFGTKFKIAYVVTGMDSKLKYSNKHEEEIAWMKRLIDLYYPLALDYIESLRYKPR